MAGLYGGLSFSEWREREQAQSELRSALHDIRSRADELEIDLDEADLPSSGKKALSNMTTEDILQEAERLRDIVSEAEQAVFDAGYQELGASDLVMLMLDLMPNKATRNALRDRINADSNDLQKLAEELFKNKPQDRARWLRSQTRDIFKERKAAELAKLRDPSFMASVAEDAKGWIKT